MAAVASIGAVLGFPNHVQGSCALLMHCCFRYCFDNQGAASSAGLASMGAVLGIPNHAQGRLLIITLDLCSSETAH